MRTRYAVVRHLRGAAVAFLSAACCVLAAADGPKVYIVNEYTAITNPDMYREYAAQVPATLEGYGARYVVRGGSPVALREGAPASVVILEFPDKGTFERWVNSPGYKRLSPMRVSATQGRTYLVEVLPEK